MKEKTIEIENISNKRKCISWIPSFEPGEKRVVSEVVWKRILRNLSFMKVIKKKKETPKDAEK